MYSIIFFLENMLNSTAMTCFLSLLGFHRVARRLQNGSLSETRREDATAVASTKLCVLVVCMLRQHCYTTSSWRYLIQVLAGIRVGHVQIKSLSECPSIRYDCTDCKEYVMFWHLYCTFVSWQLFCDFFFICTVATSKFNPAPLAWQWVLNHSSSQGYLFWKGK